MKIKNIKIKNYRSCRNTDVNLNNDLTCLIGKNGSGKTNILNGILLLKKIFLYSSYRKIQNEVNNLISEIEVEFLINNKLLYMKGEINYDIDEHNSDIILYSSLKWNYKNFISFNEDIVLPVEAFNFADDMFIVDQKTLFGTKENINFFSFNIIKQFFPIQNQVNVDQFNKIKSINKEIFKFINSINYYGASLFTDPSKSSIHFELDDANQKRRLRNNNGHDKFLMDLFNIFEFDNNEFINYKSIVDKTGFDLIDNIEFLKFPYSQSFIEVKSANKVKRKDNNRMVVVPNFTVNGLDLTPSQLSEGTFKSLALIFYILNDKSELLLIEEPEVCVHHGLLNNIVELIKTESKVKQIVISTHSDFILDKLKPENVVLINITEKKGTIAKSIDKALNKSDFKALKSYLNDTGNLGDYWKESGFEYQ